MVFTIKFLSLQKTELEYEVAIRGETPGATVADLRKQISKLSQSFPSEDVLCSHLEPLDDLQAVLDLLNKVNASLESSPTDKSTLSRIENIFHHLYHRINRIVVDEVEKPHSACSKLFKESYEKFQKLSKKAVDPLLVGVSSSASASVPGIQAPINVAVTCDRGVTSELSRLKFDGKSCVRSFIQRVYEFSEARSIPDSKLLSSATEIFTDDALHWFRSIKDQVSSWDDLVVLLKKDFDKADYDYRLLAEIRARTQGETENITIYLAILSGMFARLLKSLSEEDKLEIVLHNIRPCYASTLASATEICNIDQLRSLCRNYEIVQSRLVHFREPSAATSDTLAPEFAYKYATKAKSTYDYKSSYSYNKQSYQPLKINRNTNINQKYLHSIEESHHDAREKLPYCPRCRNNTHSFRDCSNTEVLCFKCGRKGVKKPECPNCTGKQAPKN